MARRSAEQTRQLLLDTAVTMLHEQGPAAGVLHIRLSEVVARVGLTTGAAYRLWDDQRDFHDELAVVALRWRDRSLWDRTERAVAPAVAAAAPLTEVLRQGAAANVQTLPDDAGILLVLALRATAHHHAALRRAVAGRRAEAVEAFGRLYLRVMEAYGLRLRPPFTVDHLCAAFTAVVEGFGVQTAAGEAPPTVRWAADGTDEQDWSLLGVCLMGVVDRMTEPAAAPPGPGE
ncbi:hypothetical protein JL107_14850 [Nakamurella flavida]|uniref:Uncharacterized protein n=1 Tax=Nakamurella flavida TaxID=363630 RepID=A0A938YR69_9ACTN|nr:hypothetical protein [Nakamurella flavida]MBM9477728.1 hypothetical protein [Nakamurella flavida]MDP9779280.1 AcrR family transcriptional regulator [Nakamurella flavida]